MYFQNASMINVVVEDLGSSIAFACGGPPRGDLGVRGHAAPFSIERSSTFGDGTGGGGRRYCCQPPLPGLAQGHPGVQDIRRTVGLHFMALVKKVNDRITSVFVREEAKDDEDNLLNDCPARRGGVHQSAHRHDQATRTRSQPVSRPGSNRGKTDTWPEEDMKEHDTLRIAQ